eukprot:1398996-Alexandrium_andersonii.AAC.1
MSASLVGSEMCIRDSALGTGAYCLDSASAMSFGTPGLRLSCANGYGSSAVSYTHLTLPTICSV